MSPGGTFVNVNVPFGLTDAVMVVPTTVTVIPGPTSEANPAPLRLRAESADPVIEPLIVAPLPVVLPIEPDKPLGPVGDGADDPHAPAPRPVAMTAIITIALLKFTLASV